MKRMENSMFRKACDTFIYIIMTAFSIAVIAVYGVGAYLETADGMYSLGLYEVVNYGPRALFNTLLNKWTLLYILIVICLLIIKRDIDSSSSIILSIGPLSADIMKLINMAVILACIFLVVFKTGRIKDIYDRERDISLMRSMFIENRYIIHAGGYVSDDEGNIYSYTNSMEALESCYEKGNRISEFDFLTTADGELVCAHDDESGEGWAYGINDAADPSVPAFDKASPPTLEQFKKAGFENSLTTMSLSDLADFIRSHNDFYVVTDIKDDNYDACSIIKRTCPDIIDHFIIQIYHKEEYAFISSLGFNNIIYTLYRSSWEETETGTLQQAARDYDLVGFTFWAALVDDDTFMNGMLETDTPLFVHTVNAADKMRRCIDKGISGIYTDVVDSNDRY